MNIFRKLFGKPLEINVRTAKIDEQIYLLNYFNHYASILGDEILPSQIAELFLFRAWTAQFGFRIFSSNPDVSEKLIGETVNASKYLGLGFFEETHGFSVEEELGADFISLIEDRWQNYDLVVSTMPKSAKLPTMEIMSVLANQLNTTDPKITYGLSMDFLSQLDFIKRMAITLGVLRI